jgi:tetratricopeptide (TPR) repeat protein
VLYDDAGQKDRAAALFRVLAPDNARRHRGAHRRLAMILADSVSLQSSAEDLKRFHWHLKAAMDEQSPQMSLAWGRYSIAIRDLIAARKFFRVAVAEYPDLWQMLGEIETRFGDNTAATKDFQQASEYLATRLRDRPGDHLARVDYAQVLMKLGRLDDARIILEEGQRLHPDGQWNWLLASLAVNFHDLLAVQGRPISELLAQVDRALTYEPNHGQALNRLMAYAKAKVKGNEDLKSILGRVIAEAEQPAMAHLAMGNLCWLEDDRTAASFHFERAMDIREDMALVMNNLAWLIADDEEPDLERALGLVNSALEQQPDSPNFHDTRGTIYFHQEKWMEALKELEPALKGLKNKAEPHRKLATIYKELGHLQISEHHSQLAEEAAAGVKQPVSDIPQ